MRAVHGGGAVIARSGRWSRGHRIGWGWPRRCSRRGFSRPTPWGGSPAPRRLPCVGSSCAPLLLLVLADAVRGYLRGRRVAWATGRRCIWLTVRIRPPQPNLRARPIPSQFPIQLLVRKRSKLLPSSINIVHIILKSIFSTFFTFTFLVDSIYPLTKFVFFHFYVQTEFYIQILLAIS